MKDSNKNHYAIRKELVEKSVYYIMEEDSKQLFKIEGKTLYKLYALFGDTEKLKDAIYATVQSIAIPKAAIDYFVEETYKMFDLKRLEKRLAGREKPNLDEVEFGTPHLKED